MKKIFLVLVAVMFSNFIAKAQYPNGTRVQANGKPDVYLMMNNEKRWISSEKAYLNLFDNWNGVKKITIEELNKIPTGKNITELSYLAKSSSVKNVYFVDEGKFRRWITTGDAFRKYGFSDSKIKIKNDILSIQPGIWDLE